MLQPFCTLQYREHKTNNKNSKLKVVQNYTTFKSYTGSSNTTMTANVLVISPWLTCSFDEYGALETRIPFSTIHTHY